MSVRELPPPPLFFFCVCIFFLHISGCLMPFWVPWVLLFQAHQIWSSPCWFNTQFVTHYSFLEAQCDLREVDMWLLFIAWFQSENLSIQSVTGSQNSWSALTARQALLLRVFKNGNWAEIASCVWNVVKKYTQHPPYKKLNFAKILYSTHPSLSKKKKSFLNTRKSNVCRWQEIHLCSVAATRPLTQHFRPRGWKQSSL